LGVCRDHERLPRQQSFFAFCHWWVRDDANRRGGAYYVTSIYENGFVFSANAGLVATYANAAYQLKTGRRGFVTAGVSYGYYFLQYKGFLPIVSYELRF